jgi:hypothetical protein
MSEVNEVWSSPLNIKTDANGIATGIATTATGPATGQKFDAGKIEYHYYSPYAFEQVNAVLTFGAKKYAAHNWRGGFAWSRPFNACMRHMWAWWRGEDNDPETGLSHLAHAMCCLMFLLEFTLTKKHLDDRYIPPKAD